LRSSSILSTKNRTNWAEEKTKKYVSPKEKKRNLLLKKDKKKLSLPHFYGGAM